MIKWQAMAMIIGLAMASAAFAQENQVLPPTLESGTAAEAAERLKPGQFLWVPQVAPEGPVLIIVSLKSQRAVIYRNGIPIGISTVSTGRQGYETPTGVFVILQKHVEHYSNLYDNAPMPYMQRLTWGGIALHAGNLPGYPASHGCVRLPHKFAQHLYGATKRGMTVVITDEASLPRVAPADSLLQSAGNSPLSTDQPMIWNPARSPDGPISIVISSTDRRAVILRDGLLIGSLPIDVSGTIERTSAYLLQGVVDGQRRWMRIGLPGQDDKQLERLRGRVQIREDVRRLIDPVIKIGTTVVVTSDSLQWQPSAAPLKLIESDRAN